MPLRLSYFCSDILTVFETQPPTRIWIPYYSGHPTESEIFYNLRLQPNFEKSPIPHDI